MKKFAMSLAAATMLMGGLTACGTADNEPTDPNATGYTTQNFNNGYDGHNQFDNGSRYRSQGPITDMMTPERNNQRKGNEFFDRTRAQFDRYNDTNRINKNRMSQGITGNQVPGRAGEDGVLEKRNRDGRSMNRGFNTQNNGTMNEDSRTARQIARSVNKINGVDDARVIVHNRDIVIGIEANGDATNVQREVERKVKSMANDRNVHVVTDREMVGRIRTMDDRLRTGGAMEEWGDTFSDMLRDIGSAIERPFENFR